MKILATFFMTAVMSLFSISAFADKVTITGSPVVIEKQTDFYVPATDLSPTQDYYYVAYNNSNMVCYKEVQPALASVDGGIFAFKLGTDTVQVHCYKYSPDYFIVQ